jgi:predicted TIM-barrel fold metal-dependent hydrolase
MLDPDEPIVADPHPPESYLSLVNGSRVIRAAAITIARPNNLDRTRARKFDVADPAVANVVKKSTDNGLPVLFDAYSPWDANQPGKFVNLAMAIPDAKLILAHAHGPGFPQLLVYDVVSRYPGWRRNVWIDISVTGPMLAGGPLAEQFARVLRKVGTDRIIFGSDYPLDNPLTAACAVGDLGFTGTEQAAILHDNAESLLDGK